MERRAASCIAITLIHRGLARARSCPASPIREGRLANGNDSRGDNFSVIIWEGRSYRVTGAYPNN
jgi:hypothetical protein